MLISVCPVQTCLEHSDKHFNIQKDQFQIHSNRFIYFLDNQTLPTLFSKFKIRMSHFLFCVSSKSATFCQTLYTLMLRQLTLAPRPEATATAHTEIGFCSDRSSRCHNVRLSIRPSVWHNLHLI